MTLTTSPAWQALQQHQAVFPQCWASDALPSRMLTAAGLTFDTTRQPLDTTTVQLLLALAQQESVDGWRAKLFGSAPVNTSEQRAAQHWMIRQSTLPAAMQAVEDRLWQLIDGLQNRKIDTVINIGIGGSDLGAHLVVDALQKYHVPNMGFRFVANIDPYDFQQATRGINPDTTLFIIASKGFATQETMANAERAKAWLGSRDLAKHIVATTSNTRAAGTFGIPAENCFDFPDTIGGRFSMWGPVGLIARVALGRDNWQAFIAGAQAMDDHFRTAPIDQNAPVLLALLSVWHTNFWQRPAHAVLPYSTALTRLPDYLQQVAMESNGKSVTRDGQPISWATSPLVFGGVGANAQHSFYQALHQGTQIVPSDIILLADSDDALLANGLGQAKAFYEGRRDASLPAHRQFAGQRPSTLIILPSLTPTTLGALMALYEHKAFVEGVLWRINPFDQWGVELGKQLANEILPALRDGKPASDALTAATLATIQAYRRR